jgi:hypothetical protein
MLSIVFKLGSDHFVLERACSPQELVDMRRMMVIKHRSRR